MFDEPLMLYFGPRSRLFLSARSFFGDEQSAQRLSVSSLCSQGCVADPSVSFGDEWPSVAQTTCLPLWGKVACRQLSVLAQLWLMFTDSTVVLWLSGYSIGEGSTVTMNLLGEYLAGCIDCTEYAAGARLHNTCACAALL